MKTLTTLTAVAALVAGIAIANAQSSSSSSMGKGTAATPGSSSMQKTATGSGKFCIENSKGGGLTCKYASMDACQKDAQAQHLNCSPNPNTGTTGAK